MTFYKLRDSVTPTFFFYRSFCTCFCCCGSKSLPLWSVMVEIISSSFWDFEACCCLRSWFRGQWLLQQWREHFHNQAAVMSRWGGQYHPHGRWIGVMVNRIYTINFLFSPLCEVFCYWRVLRERCFPGWHTLTFISMQLCNHFQGGEFP